MRSVTAKELRSRTAPLLDQVRRGHEIIITYRGRSIAALVPLATAQARSCAPLGSGMWRDRKDMRSFDKWLRRLRASRHGIACRFLGRR